MATKILRFDSVEREDSVELEDRSSIHDECVAEAEQLKAELQEARAEIEALKETVTTLETKGKIVLSALISSTWQN